MGSHNQIFCHCSIKTGRTSNKDTRVFHVIREKAPYFMIKKFINLIGDKKKKTWSLRQQKTWSCSNFDLVAIESVYSIFYLFLYYYLFIYYFRIHQNEQKIIIKSCLSCHYSAPFQGDLSKPNAKQSSNLCVCVRVILLYKIKPLSTPLENKIFYITLFQQFFYNKINQKTYLRVFNIINPIKFTKYTSVM